MSVSSMKYLGVRVPAELLPKMERVLAAEGLQITEYVRGLIREDLRKRGLLKEEPEGSAQPAGASH